MSPSQTPTASERHIERAERTFRARDGVEISVRVHSSATPGRRAAGSTFVCLPNIDRTAREFDAFAQIACAAEDTTIMAIDGRGRGKSGAGAYGQTKDADDLVDMLTAMGVEHAHFIASGYGGVVVLPLAAARPAAVKALTLVDAAPVIDATGLARLQYRLRREPIYDSRSHAIERLMAYDQKQFPRAEAEEFGHMVDAAYAPKTESGKARWAPDLRPGYLKRLANLDLSESLTPRWDLFAGFSRTNMMIVQPENSTMVSAPSYAAMLSKRRAVHASTRHISLANQGSTPVLNGKLARAVLEFHHA